MTLGSQCFFVSTNTLTWFKAREDCVQKGGNLAKVINQTELDTLKAAGSLTGVSYWIGLVGLVWYWPQGLRNFQSFISFQPKVI